MSLSYLSIDPGEDGRGVYRYVVGVYIDGGSQYTGVAFFSDFDQTIGDRTVHGGLLAVSPIRIGGGFASRLSAKMDSPRVTVQISSNPDHTTPLIKKLNEAGNLKGHRIKIWVVTDTALGDFSADTPRFDGIAVMGFTYENNIITFEAIDLAEHILQVAVGAVSTSITTSTRTPIDIISTLITNEIDTVGKYNGFGTINGSEQLKDYGTTWVATGPRIYDIARQLALEHGHRIWFDGKNLNWTRFQAPTVFDTESATITNADIIAEIIDGNGATRSLRNLVGYTNKTEIASDLTFDYGNSALSPTQGFLRTTSGSQGGTFGNTFIPTQTALFYIVTNHTATTYNYGLKSTADAGLANPWTSPAPASSARHTTVREYIDAESGGGQLRVQGTWGGMYAPTFVDANKTYRLPVDMTYISYMPGDVIKLIADSNTYNIHEQAFAVVDATTVDLAGYAGSSYDKIILDCVALQEYVITTPAATSNFDAVAYTGSGASKTIATDVNPNLILIKNRDATQSWILTDDLRGASAQLLPDDTSAELALGTMVADFNYDTPSFDVSTHAAVNGNTNGIISYVWQLGYKQYAIHTETSTGEGPSTFNHSLGTIPTLMFAKRRDSGSGYVVYHQSQGATKYLELTNSTVATASTGAWNDTEPTSTLVTYGNFVSADAQSWVWHLFADQAGVLKTGTYTGTGVTTTITTGLLPRLVIIKRTDAVGSWWVLDSERPATEYLRMDYPLAAGTSSELINAYQSTSFVLGTNAATNADGGTFIYMAWG